jgi:hypothetical protein
MTQRLGLGLFVGDFVSFAAFLEQKGFKICDEKEFSYGKL